MKADCVFLFLFQPFKFKAYFLVLFLMGKNQVAQLESEDLAGMEVLPPGSVPPQSFLWQVLEHSCRLKLMSLGEVKPALEGGTKKCFYKTTTFRPRFYAELYQFIIEGNLGESRNIVCRCVGMRTRARSCGCVCVCIGQNKKAIYFSLKTSNNILLQGKSRIHNGI